MEMKKYLTETFKFNDQANKKILAKIKQLPEPEECINFFSHLINSQNKWLARIQQHPEAPRMSWWVPVYALEKLESEWDKSLKTWLDFIDDKTEKELFAEATFVGFDSGRWSAILKDIVLQLNYHSIHHRAQMQTIIRKQGLTRISSIISAPCTGRSVDGMRRLPL